MSTSLIANAFTRLALRDRSRTAIFGLGGLETRTFGELRDDADAMRAALTAVPLGDPPCLVAAIGNHPAFFAVLIAALELGARIALFDAVDRGEAIEDTARRLGADAIVRRAGPSQAGTGAARSAHRLPQGLSATPRTTSGVVLTGNGNSSFHFGENDTRGRPSILKITSGSTGAPRVVVATEANMVADATQIVEAMAIGPDDVSLAVIPLAHSYGLGNLVMPLLLQGSPIALRESFAPRALADDAAAAGVSVLPGVPYQYDYLLRDGLVDAVARIRLLITAGAPIGRETLEGFARAGRVIHSFYGTSETGGISFDADPAAGDRVSVGRPLPGVSVAFEDADGAPASSGRVVVRSAAVARGYAWPGGDDGAPDDRAFANGAFRTGDLGERDDEGRLYLTGRISRFVNVAGRKVDPAEIERVVTACPGVRDAVVFGVADPQRGEGIAAVVSAAGGATAGSVRAYCAARLAPHKVPRVIRLVERLPYDARGKLDRRVLETLAGADPAGGSDAALMP